MSRHPQPLPLVRTMRTDKFYGTYRVTGPSGILEGDPNAVMALAIDGWAAAIAVVEHFTVSRGEADGVGLPTNGERLRAHLLRGRIETKHLVLESIRLFSRATAATRFSGHRYNDEGVQLASHTWETMCTRNGYAQPVPSEITILKPHEDRSCRGINVNVREPLYFPASYDPTTRRAPGFGRFSSSSFPNDLVPESAVFFASRLDCLRNLVEEWKRDHNVSAEHGTPRKDDCEKEIYCVLLSMFLYMMGVMAPGALTVCRYSAGEWLAMYQAGTTHGSEIFGLAGGFDQNWRFISEHVAALEHWCKAAAGWWIQGQSSTDVEDRDGLASGLLGMIRELLLMYHNMSLLGGHPAHIPQSRQQAAA